MRRTRTIKGLAIGGFAAVAVAGISSMAGAQNMNVIPIAPGAQAESIAGTPDGGLIIGTTGGAIYRVAPGGTESTLWLQLEGFVLGVFAVGDTAYVCNQSNLRAFDLDTGDPTGVFEFPGGGFCNDIAISPDGTVFVTDTNFGGGPGRVLALVDGEDGPALQVVIAAVGIGGVDGLAFVGDALYVNDVRLDLLYRLDLDGVNLTGFTTLETNQAMDGPDGLRVTEDGTALYQAENGALIATLVTIDGDNAFITVLGGGFPAATAVAVVGNTLYVVGAIFRDADPEAMTYVHTVGGGGR